jgi:hypothetical protein
MHVTYTQHRASGSSKASDPAHAERSNEHDEKRE